MKNQVIQILCVITVLLSLGESKKYLLETDDQLEGNVGGADGDDYLNFLPFQKGSREPDHKRRREQAEEWEELQEKRRKAIVPCKADEDCPEQNKCLHGRYCAINCRRC
ncbi:uncharacterized protein LOC111713672 [Eurytemora carolleeae]|uniref:uncharacterized protein LOC111713672 n=1 Tax=Eurytemora carolleeae TaxID=1294199 RepID=UPI000C785241|nr:uncharacterized protein LOC111713672 [Eurytemora carolleeae]|eukprot:XP_023344365.1 uncharacterized protein LOC111713672 [Eurytemora affinis]